MVEQHQDARVSPVPLKKSHLSPSAHFLGRLWKACRMESQVHSEENPFLGGSFAQLRARNREFEPVRNLGSWPESQTPKESVEPVSREESNGSCAGLV